ncbi:PP2C family protein-serine/threonine phosphatase [Crocinitomix catalasitica]|uniref:PP2C family protein-serine/threonine phosphatase n=1 Tax=Crocinitomix catalasitica TaxID=184607 RepID=UPI000486ABD5|nr:SpoIIE family protein phosphatase [Crocinitomix catalasitica]
MTKIINHIFRNLTTRILLLIYLGLILITILFITIGYVSELSLQKERQYDRLKGIVTSTAIQIEGEQHAAIFDANSTPTAIQNINTDPNYLSIHKVLEKCVAANNLTSPIYTLVMNPIDSTFSYGVRSDDFIDFRNGYKLSPTILIDAFNTGGIIPVYSSENGIWLSAFHPIRDKEGKTIALLEADIEFSEFKSIVIGRFLKETLIALFIIALFSVILIYYARRILKKEELHQELITNQKRIIELKNKDITDSIRYAQRIQNSILPSKKGFDAVFSESFIFYQPKDIVAGDFYWFEEKENLVFFAVADCTGHGVPGSIMSLLCSNALNTAVDVLNLTDTAAILNEVRAFIIKRLGKADSIISDGMDIALCCFNKTTLELQFSGANNPVYIFSEDAFVISNPNKQPVANYIKPVPFTSEYFQLKKGDVLFLFTDGFYDQFGGTKGKKYMQKRFKTFLNSIKDNTCEEQGELIDQEFNNWRGDTEQIDDVCIVGVRI